MSFLDSMANISIYLRMHYVYSYNSGCFNYSMDTLVMLPPLTTGTVVPLAGGHADMQYTTGIDGTTGSRGGRRLVTVLRITGGVCLIVRGSLVSIYDPFLTPPRLGLGMWSSSRSIVIGWSVWWLVDVVGNHLIYCVCVLMTPPTTSLGTRRNSNHPPTTTVLLFAFTTNTDYDMTRLLGMELIKGSVV